MNLVKELTGRYKDNKAARKSKRDLARLVKQLNKKLESALPAAVMGNKNYNKAVSTVRDLTKNSDMMGAREYVKGQLNKTMQQAYNNKDNRTADYLRSRSNRINL